jgi:uncharacterized protein (DUF1697 family)
MEKIILISKREGADFACYSRWVNVESNHTFDSKIGTILADGSFVEHGYTGDEYSIQDKINERFEPHMPLDIRLMIVREAYEYRDRMEAAIYAAENAAENAWLRAAENAIPEADLRFEEESEAMDIGLMTRREAWANN